MRRAVFIAAVVLVCAGPTHAQQKPDFSGRWAMVVDPNSARGLAGLLVGICGSQCDVTQGRTTLTIKRTPTLRTPIPDVLTIDWTQSRRASHLRRR